MLDIKMLREDPQYVAEQLKRRKFEFDVDQFQQLDQTRKEAQTRTEALQAERNAKSKEIGQAKAQGKDVQAVIQQMSVVNDKLKKNEVLLADVQQQLQDILYQLPNLLDASVPNGLDEANNVEVSRWGEPSEFDFEAQDHVALGEKRGWMDFKTAAKISGSRFVVLRGPLARMQRALIDFMLDIHTKEHGYTEVYVPNLVNSDSLFGTGQLPKFAEDQFRVMGEQDLWLIPTAEVPVTNFMRGEVVSGKELPLKFVAHTPCFRSEAGSYGKDTRGMIRQHQFEKVEMVQIVKPEESFDALEVIRSNAETILQRLGIAYRVVVLCAGDTGFCSAKTYDLEVWLPGQKKYREISSCSNLVDFQARRMDAKYRDADGHLQYVHTLNGSGLAVGRTLIAVMENYQDAEGHIHVPEALQPYMGGVKVL
ncbi:MAG: serine--tRNA ligase [Pseudomonadota bacterium]|nr:serine--tRNA ligase [Gammaproteobacteria bacterium]MBU1558428.1 serine--tRNA ligase [Gammaproteobacteria bacterium]MBU1629224.1 serine--tRNA ligase [Gammaproteobacteria bacterium]MBU1926945.1 serine--tRNA ligase [Gammaproteobacteria bacterium]MBU2545913.1 serine--tRNA ligase [Gammaproteobacteria bacterium]